MTTYRPATAHQRLEKTSAEAEIELLQAFVNTNDVDTDRDALGTPEQLREWLAGRGLVDPSAPADREAHRRALAVREGIRALGRANNGEPIARADVATMNEAARSVALTVSVEPAAGEGAWRLVPAGSGIDGFVGRILATVAASMAAGTWSRVKACRNDTCQWLFFDRSRNRSGTWCTMAACGSVMKARAYRARQREAATT
jgi:predicted RNA-binding Zn ribbon-like protein